MEITKNILMRGGKSPLVKTSYEEALQKNLLGTNSGNLLFADAVFKTLSLENTSIHMNGYSANPRAAKDINEKYDVFVLPFANAFRKSFIPILNKFTLLISQLEIPVVVTGIGAQANTDYESQNLDDMSEAVKLFCKKVLQRSASIGVRGEFTKKYLLSLGFADHEIDVIGCPSMFYYGETFPEINKPDKLNVDDPISMNISPYVPGIEEIFNKNFFRYPNIDYVAQNNESLDQILFMGNSLPKPGRVFPKDINHPLFYNNQVRFFIDSRTWLNHLEKKRFVFGTRIHGNIAALLAGTPAFLLAHDSRTLELAEYFDIPHADYAEIGDNHLAEDFFERADYTKLVAGHSERFKQWVKFLNKNELEHIYLPGKDNGDLFNSKLESVNFAPIIDSFQHQSSSEILERLVERSFHDSKKNSRRIDKLAKRTAALELEISHLKKQKPERFLKSFFSRSSK